MSGLICAFGPCRKAVTGQVRIEVHRVDDADVPFGPGIRGFPLADADGPLVDVFHTRCWWGQVKRDRLAAARRADPSGYSGSAPDWREPETCDVEDLRGGVARDYRGTGKAPD
jgi:hypothetical protein